MKIYVSPYYRTAMWGAFISIIVIDMILIYISFSSLEVAYHTLTDPVDRTLFIFFLLVYWIILLLLFAMIWRSLIHTKVEEDSYQSYLGRRKQCYVDRTKDIYYTVFGYPLRKDTYGKNAYIAFSNEPFTANSSLTIFNGYDTKKVIVIPYYEETLPYLDVEKWHKIEMEYPESMKKMEKWFK